jgi:hypothetical protein
MALFNQPILTAEYLQGIRPAEWMKDGLNAPLEPISLSDLGLSDLVITCNTEEVPVTRDPLEIEGLALTFEDFAPCTLELEASQSPCLRRFDVAASMSYLFKD